MPTTDWIEIAKLTPGWLSGVWLVGTAARKAVIRRHRVRIGPAKEARELLVSVRSAFRHIAVNRPTKQWFTKDGRDDLEERLSDLIHRVKDRKLQSALGKIAGCWASITDVTPASGPFALVEGTEYRPTPDEQDEGRRHQQQRDHASEGMRLVTAALRRLDKLERKTVGR